MAGGQATNPPAMPAYDFKCDTCKRAIEERHSIHQIPASVECVCGGLATRMLSIGSAVNTQPCSSKYPYVSRRLPKNAAGCKTDKAGRPVIQSRKHEDRVLKTLGYDRE